MDSQEKLTYVEDVPAAPARPGQSHKGTYGTAIVVGGSDTMIGAPALAARAALRVGAGLVKLAVPGVILPWSISIEPGATGIGLGDDADAAVALIDQADPESRAVLAIGPGMGGADNVWPLVSRLLRGKRAMVLDADGLNSLASWGQPRPAGGGPVVMTPHPGEFARLAKPLGIEERPTSADERPGAAGALARAHGAVVVLKGHRTVVSDGERVFVNETGNPCLATAGTGDVLTGAIAGLLAQGMDLFDAAVLGVHVHGLSADRWSSLHGLAGMRAQELADGLPEALRDRGQAG